MKQGIITPHFGRVVGKRMQLRQGDGNDHLSLWLRRGGSFRVVYEVSS